MGRAVVWFFALGDQYGLDPIVFGRIHVGGNPLFRTISCLTNQDETESKITYLSYDFSRVMVYVVLPLSFHSGRKHILVDLRHCDKPAGLCRFRLLSRYPV